MLFMLRCMRCWPALGGICARLGGLAHLYYQSLSRDGAFQVRPKGRQLCIIMEGEGTGRWGARQRVYRQLCQLAMAGSGLPPLVLP